jgi:hypothetical protein
VVEIEIVVVETGTSEDGEAVTNLCQTSLFPTFLQTSGFFLVPAIAPAREQLFPPLVAETDVVGKARCKIETHKTSARTLFFITSSHYSAPASLEFLYR